MFTLSPSHEREAVKKSMEEGKSSPVVGEGEKGMKGDFTALQKTKLLGRFYNPR
jgi:hypothetical protein